MDDAGTSWILKTIYYDDRGRAIQSLKTLYPSGTEITSVQYDFSGNVLNERKHVNYNSVLTTVVTSHEYDTRGRLLREKQKVNSGAEITLNEFTYDGLGRQKSRKIGGVETLVNEYNTRGWLTAIRGSKFTEELRYDECLLSSETSICFNGNISSMTWKNGTGERQAYFFQYDGLNRLKQALYGSGTTIAKTGKHDVTGLTYDKNGNILTLKRKNNGTLVDDLVYRYAGNRLMNVKDGTGNAFGYAGTSVLSENRYDYDGNGNLLKDLNKKVTGISYNFLNLTRKVTTNGRVTSYTYTAGGEKLQVAYPGKTLSHVGSLVFEGSSLKYILTGSGRYVVNGSSVAHEYHLADHLGNVRVVLNESGAVVQSNDYYPFGMLMAQSGSSDNQYLYNGQELQEETGWLDYGWRMYDAAIGRWGCLDPLSENHYNVSGYAYVLNNPLSYVDYLGLDNISPDKVDWPNFNPDKDVIELDEVPVFAKRRRGGFIGFGSSAGQYYRNNRYGDYWQEQGLKINWDNTVHNKQLDQLQNVLDGLGLCPVFGEGFDGINAGIYFLRGDNLNGSLSLGAMVPFAGWAATGAKVGMKATKAALTNPQLVQKAAKMAEKAVVGKGPVVGTAKHKYASTLLKRYQKMYGDRGLDIGHRFGNTTGNQGILDVLDNTNKIIYDFKFGSANMGKAQFDKYTRNIGYPIQIIRP